jgi:hypothetical protein
VLLALAALCLWSAFALNLQGAAVAGQGSGSDSVDVAAMLAIGLAFTVGGSAVLERKIRLPAATAAALIGLAVGVVTALMPNHTAVRTLAGSATFVVGMAVALTVRRRGARPAHEPLAVSAPQSRGKGML